MVGITEGLISHFVKARFAYRKAQDALTYSQASPNRA